MANEASNITTQRTIRDYIASRLTENNPGTGQGGVGLKISLSQPGGGISLQQVYEVDLIWSGQEYLIAYKVAVDSAFPKIQKLNDVLPITFYDTSVTSTP